MQWGCNCSYIEGWLTPLTLFVVAIPSGEAATAGLRRAAAGCGRLLAVWAARRLSKGFRKDFISSIWMNFIGNGH